MGTVLIIFDHPPVSCFSHFSQISEEVQAKHLLAIGSVEALDGEMLQELVEWARDFPGLVENTLMHRRGGVLETSRH
jgi:hypothetical protein